MSRATAVLAPVREWLFLERAEHTTRRYTSAQQARVAAHTRGAEGRIRAARSLSDALSASVLLRSAIVHLLRARSAALDATREEEAYAAGELAVGLPELPGSPEVYDARVDTERARAALVSRDPLYFDRLSLEALEATRGALERMARHLRAQIEPRSPLNVRATRWGRWTSIAIVLVYAVVRLLWEAFLPTNVALHKPVHPSSYKHNPPDGHELVDGQPIKGFGVHTNTEDSPRVVIDLLRPYTITTIRVHNRGDGWFDDCLPLVVELSNDGEHYEPVGRREVHFDQVPPWIIDAHKSRARYVRLRVDRRSYIALSEVEVFGTR